MNNDLYIHANGLIERFKQEREKAMARKEWMVANAWSNAISIVEEPETNVEILKQIPTAKLPTAVGSRRFDKGEWEHWAGDLQRCSSCGEEFSDYVPIGNFCPNCGADMRKDGDRQ